jgi:hypothetical protein
MKTKLFFTSILSLLFASSFAQDKTTVNAKSSEISDNLDLRAVASIFGDSKDLEDFERRLNDPKTQISNLDLNDDNQVDYLRVIESVEGRTHLIVVQSVLGKDTFQDVATIEVEKDNNNNTRVQVVGDVYMYGSNYIYEPVYVHVPVIYSNFWVDYYRPYCSSWYWDYYPTYYYAWNPFPLFRYRHNVGLWINYDHHYNYGTTRHCASVYNNYYGRRGNGYERQYPNRSFNTRNSGYSNRQELDKTREKTRRNDVAYADTRNNSGRNEGSIRSNGTTRNTENTPVRASNPRSETTRNESVRNDDTPVRASNPRIETTRNESVKNENLPVRASNPRSETTRNESVKYDNVPVRASNPRSETTRSENVPVRVSTPRNENTRTESAPVRASTTRSYESQPSRQSSRNESVQSMPSRNSGGSDSRASGNSGGESSRGNSSGGRR